jgi:hypothetical protein
MNEIQANNENELLDPNEPTQPSELEKIDWLAEAHIARKQGNKKLFHTIMRYLGRGKHTLQKGTKGAFGRRHTKRF